MLWRHREIRHVVTSQRETAMLWRHREIRHVVTSETFYSSVRKAQSSASRNLSWNEQDDLPAGKSDRRLFFKIVSRIDSRVVKSWIKSMSPRYRLFLGTIYFGRGEGGSTSIWCSTDSLIGQPEEEPSETDYFCQLFILIGLSFICIQFLLQSRNSWFPLKQVDYLFLVDQKQTALSSSRNRETVYETISAVIEFQESVE